MEPAVPWQIRVGYSEYRQQLAAVEALVAKNNEIPPVSNLNDRNGSTPSTLVLVIGDTPFDIEAAAKLGIGAIGFRSGGFPDEALLRAGAIALYDGPADLLARYESSPLVR